MFVVHRHNVSLKKNLLYNFLLSLSQIAFPLISIPYISRVLDKEGLGNVGTIDSLTYYFIVIAEFGVATYGIREVARKRDEPEKLNTVVSELLSLHLLTSAISTVLFIVFTTIVYQKVGDVRLILLGLSFLLVNSFACEWYFWGVEQFRYIAFRSITVRLLGLAAIFMLVKAPEDYVIYYAIICLSAIAILVWNFVKMASEVKISFRKINWRKHIPFVSVTYKISLVYGVVLLLDNVFLRLLTTGAAVAYYMFAAKVVRIGGNVVTDALLVLYPRTVSLVHKSENQALQSTISRSMQLIFLTTIPMSAGLFLLAEKFTTVYFGTGMLRIAPNLKILALYPVVKAYSLFLDKQILMPFNKEKLVLRGLTAGAIVFVVATLPLSHFYADIGTSLAVIIAEVTVLLFNYYYAFQLNSGLKVFEGRTILQAVAGAALFIPIVYLAEWLLHKEVTQLVATIVLCIIVYGVFLLSVKNDFLLSLSRSFLVKNPSKNQNTPSLKKQV